MKTPLSFCFPCRHGAGFLRILTPLFAFLTAASLSLHSEGDNRIKPGINVGDPIPDDIVESYPSEENVRAKIAESHDTNLVQSLGGGFLTLKWQKRVPLVDADYILCLFDSSAHSEPGNNPRVLVLFTPDYKIATWGRFTCEPFFAFGSVVNRFHRPETYFITINPAGRFGGELFFEKYLISAKEIRKLGEGYEITKIPES